MKRTKWLSLMVISALALTACNNAGGGAGETGTAGTKTGEQSAAPTDDKKPDTVKVWTYPVHAAYEDDLKQLVADFTKTNPHIKVEYEMLSWAEGPKKFDVALNAGDPPDLYFHSVSGQYVNTGLALQLDSFLTKEIKDDYQRERWSSDKSRANSTASRCTNSNGLGAATSASWRKPASIGRKYKRAAGRGPNLTKRPRS